MLPYISDIIGGVLLKVRRLHGLRRYIDVHRGILVFVAHFGAERDAAEQLRRGHLRIDRTIIIIVPVRSGDPVGIVQIQHQQVLARVERHALAVGVEDLGRDLHAGVKRTRADVLHIHHFVHDAAGHDAHGRERIAVTVLVVQRELDRAHRDDVVRRADGRKVRPRTDRQQCHCQ